jgi:nucleotide-binding universal stress UspA family protein
MQVQTILHPTDHSEPDRAALRYAVSLAHDYGARLLILHVVSTPGLDVVPPPPDSVRPRPDARVVIEYQLAHGDPVATILRTARERSCDLIVLGSPAASGWQRWLRGSRVEKITSQAPCPVLVVKEAMRPRSRPGQGEGAAEGTPLSAVSG